MNKKLVIMLSLILILVFPNTVFAGKDTSSPDWEDDFIEGCEANGGVPFEWDFGIGCDFDTRYCLM